jgi:hypothetical protein
LSTILETCSASQELSLDLKLQKLPPGKPISERENDQVYLSKLVFKKFAEIKIKIFSMAEFADGKWYSLSQKVKDKSNPNLNGQEHIENKNSLMNIIINDPDTLG